MRCRRKNYHRYAMGQRPWAQCEPRFPEGTVCVGSDSEFLADSDVSQNRCSSLVVSPFRWLCLVWLQSVCSSDTKTLRGLLGALTGLWLLPRPLSRHGHRLTVRRIFPCYPQALNSPVFGAASSRGNSVRDLVRIIPLGLRQG